MQFEWDEEKSRKTKESRGLDFHQASKIWDDPESIEIPVRSETEPRLAKVGILNGKVYTVIFIPRGSITRIISARRSHPKEIELYEQS